MFGAISWPYEELADHDVLLIKCKSPDSKVRGQSGSLNVYIFTTKRNIKDRDMSAIELLTPHLNSIKIPGNSQKIYKDECVYSFDTPVSSFKNLSVNSLMNWYGQSNCYRIPSTNGG